MPTKYNEPSTGKNIGTNDVPGGDSYQIINMGFGLSGAAPTQVSTANPLPVRTAPVGQGAIQPLPTATPTGATLPGLPTTPAPSGVRFYLKSTDASIKYVMATAAPGSAPATNTTNTITYATHGAVFDEPASGGMLPYILETTGTNGFRWI